MIPLSQWAAKVHARCLEHGPITADEATGLFGSPVRGTATACLTTAKDNGWFRVEEGFEEAGVLHEPRFHAIDIAPRTRRTPSYFDGIRRVRSVFELGAIE